jgi:hypothetical protein
MKRYPLSLLFLLSGLFVAGQSPQDALQRLKDSFPQERIHIHFDKDVYMAGETSWFKAYLFSGFLPSDLSANFIAELVDPNGRVVMRKKMPIISATVSGNFELPDTLAQGSYTVRAYTPWMLNFDDGFIFRKSIYIYKPGPGKNVERQNTGNNRIDFFPEGGELAAGVVNVVAFKATDAFGMPVNVTGRLLDANGSELNMFNSIHDGMGTFGFVPQAGKEYFAAVTFDDSSAKKIKLPLATDVGYSLQVREESETKRRIIVARSPGATPVPLTLIGQMQHQLLFQQVLEPQGSTAVLSVDTRSFPSGILQLTVLSGGGEPLVERLVFINNNDYRLPIDLKQEKVSLEKKAKNILSFTLPDSIVGSYSVAVVDDERTLENKDADDIVSRLLLTADLKGYVHNPSFYFASNNRSTRALLDLVMMTNGWRRFQWKEILANRFPEIRHHDQNYIQISGTVYSSRTKKPIEGGEANFILRTKDSVTDFFQASVGKDGRFYIDNLAYSDSAEFSFQLNTKKNREKELFIKLDNDTVDFARQAAGIFASSPVSFPLYVPVSDSLNLLYTISTDTSGRFKLLEAVTVTAKKRRPVDELNARYARGIFASMNMVRILDLVNNNAGAGALNVLQYIQGRIGGIRVVTAGFPPQYQVYNNRAMSLTGGPIPVPLFLDEMSVTPAQLETVPMHQVAMIKYFTTGFMGNPGSGSSSALAVYTKKGPDLASSADYLNAFKYPGYSVVRQFYAPDYDASPSSRALPDRRTTLLWQPEVKFDANNEKYLIEFFNSDNARKIKVVIEGMTADGKLVREVRRF